MGSSKPPKIKYLIQYGQGVSVCSGGERGVLWSAISKLLVGTAKLARGGHHRRPTKCEAMS